jgi:beta-phosphoglucomutase-like phosphatase (HAD superfamily)
MYFDVVVTADDITVHKPNPEVYQRTATLLGTDPSRCVVFEDAPAGIRAAKAASMRCIAVATPYTSPDQLQEADLIIPSMEVASLQTIRSLVIMDIRQE